MLYKKWHVLFCILQEINFHSISVNVTALTKLGLDHEKQAENHSNSYSNNQICEQDSDTVTMKGKKLNLNHFYKYLMKNGWLG